LLADEADRETTYLIAPELRDALAGEPTCAPYQLYVCIDRQKNVTLWKVRLPKADGRSNLWWDTAHDAAAQAREAWVRVYADSVGGCYQCERATANYGEPVWPDRPLCDLLEIAFKGKRIDSFDHPVLRRLRGEA
jgi:hypothetical protein